MTGITVGTGLAIAAGVGAVGSIAGGLISAKATSSAASEEVSAAQNATQLQAAEFNTVQQDQAPWLKAGNTALQRLITGLAPGGQFATPAPTINAASYTQSPGYNAAVSAGNSQINAQAAAKGLSLSPTTQIAEGQFTANAALQDYDTWYNQQLQTNQQQLQSKQVTLGGLESVAGLGQTGAQSVTQAGTAAATNEGNISIGEGNTLAASTLAGAQLTTGALNSGLTSLTNPLNSYLTSQYYANLFGGGSGGGGGGDGYSGGSVTGAGYSNPGFVEPQV